MLKEKNAAVIVLTPAAKEIALKLKAEYRHLDLYLPAKLDKENENSFTFTSLSSLVGKIFKKYDALIFIMALGIVVRIIAPLLESKKSDPAVLTVDDTAQSVISTLSGHLGGANQLTAEIADFLKARPVITTATDCNNKLAVDLLAQRLDCTIKPFGRLKKANGALLFGRDLHIFSDYKIKIEADDNIEIYSLEQLPEIRNSQAFEVIISNQKFKLQENQLQLIPRNIVLGIGCRKNTAAAEIRTALNRFLAELNLLPASIKKIATIDLKKEEEGILELAAENNWPLEIVSREKIKAIEADLDIKKSDFVKKITGAAAAASPAAILASAAGKLIVDKKKYEGITFSVFEEEVADE